jgi:hypothetical protein
MTVLHEIGVEKNPAANNEMFILSSALLCVLRG